MTIPESGTPPRGIVARALDQEKSWRDVARCLASTPVDARRRMEAAPRTEPPLDR